MRPALWPRPRRRITDLARSGLRVLSNPAILAMTSLVTAAGPEGAMVTGLRSTLTDVHGARRPVGAPGVSLLAACEHIDLFGHNARIVAYSGKHLAGDET
jgi:hypothetical protein